MAEKFGFEIKIASDKTGEVLAEVSKRSTVALEAVGQKAEDNAVREVTKAVYDTPPAPTYKRTGRLRSSITHSVDSDNMSVSVGSNVEYAPYVELGSSRAKRGPRPFIKPALENYQAQYSALIKEIFGG